MAVKSELEAQRLHRENNELKIELLKVRSQLAEKEGKIAELRITLNRRDELETELIDARDAAFDGWWVGKNSDGGWGQKLPDLRPSIDNYAALRAAIDPANQEPK